MIFLVNQREWEREREKEKGKEKEKEERDRVDKHHRLLRMIQGYKLTEDQRKGIQDSKKQTLFQISMRFARCPANKSYKFPCDSNDSLSQDDNTIEDILPKRTILFDLHTQRKKSYKRSLDSSKVKTEESKGMPARSISLKKIEAREQTMLTRIRENKEREREERLTLEKSRKVTERSPEKDKIPMIDKRQHLHLRQNSDKMIPINYGLAQHKRLVTEEVRFSHERNKEKLKTEQSLGKFRSHKMGNEYSRSSKAEMLLLGVKSRPQWKRTLVNRPQF